MPRPIFILNNVPGVTPNSFFDDIPVTAWKDICHMPRSSDFVFVEHQQCRSPSRWTCVENKRPFIVFTRGWHKLGASSTLDGAIAIARRRA